MPFTQEGETDVHTHRHMMSKLELLSQPTHACRLWYVPPRSRLPRQGGGHKLQEIFSSQKTGLLTQQRWHVDSHCHVIVAIVSRQDVDNSSSQNYNVPDAECNELRVDDSHVAVCQQEYPETLSLNCDKLSLWALNTKGTCVSIALSFEKKIPMHSWEMQLNVGSETALRFEIVTNHDFRFVVVSFSNFPLKYFLQVILMCPPVMCESKSRFTASQARFGFRFRAWILRSGIRFKKIEVEHRWNRIRMDSDSSWLDSGPYLDLCCSDSHMTANWTGFLK